MTTLKKLCLEILAKCLCEEEDISIKQIPQPQCAELLQILSTRKQLSKHIFTVFSRDCEFLLHVDVSKSSLIINQSLNLIGAIESLVSLNLSGCRNFASSTLSSIKGLPCLAILDLSKTKIDDYALLDVKTLPSLRTLNLSDTAITDSGIRLLCSSTGIQKSDSNVLLDSQDDPLPSLSSFPKLEQLNLTRTLISDASIEMLSETHLTESLQDLQLVGLSKLSTKCARFLTRFKKLRRVNLQATSFMLYGTKTLQKMFAQQPENQNVEVNSLLEIKITKKEPLPTPVAERSDLPNSNSLWDMNLIKTFLEAPSQECRKRSLRTEKQSSDMDLDSMFHTPSSHRSPVKNKAPKPKPRVPLANITNTINSPSISLSLFQTFSPQVAELTPLTSKTKSFTKKSAFTSSWDEPSTSSTNSPSSSSTTTPSKTTTPSITRTRPSVQTPYKTPTSKSTQTKPSSTKKNNLDVFEFDSDDDMFNDHKNETESITDAEMDSEDDEEERSSSTPSVIVELRDEEVIVDVESVDSDNDDNGTPKTPSMQEDSFIAEPLLSPSTPLSSNKKRPQASVTVTELCSDLSPSGSCDELESNPNKKKRTINIGTSPLKRSMKDSLSRNDLLKLAEECALQRMFLVQQ